MLPEDAHRWIALACGYDRLVKSLRRELVQSIPATGTLEQIERAVVRDRFEACGQNKAKTAASLGIARATLDRYLAPAKENLLHSAA